MNTATLSPSEKQARGMGLRRAENDRVWDWLRAVAQNVRNYQRAPAILLPLLGDKKLQTSIVDHNKTATLNNLVQALTKDAKAFSHRFKDIYAKHSSRRGSSSDIDDMMHCVSVSQEYLQFVSSYEMVIMPTLNEVLELMEAAGLDVSSVRATADSKLVYDLYENSDSPAA